MASIRPSPCPSCHEADVRKLEELSYITTVDYHRCGRCDHVWTTDKTTGQIQMHVTPLRPAVARDLA